MLEHYDDKYFGKTSERMRKYLMYEPANDKWQARTQSNVKAEQPKSKQTKRLSEKLFVLATPLNL